jgi:hypothetical protein
VSLSVYHLSLQGNGLLNTFPPERRIFGGVILYAVRVVSKEKRLFVLTRASYYSEDTVRQR